MGQAMAQAMGAAAKPAEPAAPAAATPTVCRHCQAKLEKPSKFCPECGGALA